MELAFILNSFIFRPYSRLGFTILSERKNALFPFRPMEAIGLLARTYFVPRDHRRLDPSIYTAVHRTSIQV